MFLLALISGQAQEITGVTEQARKTFGESGSVTYWSARATGPRPLWIHHLMAEYRPDVFAVSLAADPDADGPIEAKLQAPFELLQQSTLTAAVNANAFARFQPSAQGPKYHHDMPVNIAGLAVAKDDPRSEPAKPYIAFWVDRAGRPHFGNPDGFDDVAVGCAGFGWLLKDGEVVGPAGPLHPRTAIGMDAKQQRLFLVVVDGRQPGYSEGVQTLELAHYMKSLGCHQAINLDGGGSSIMIAKAKTDRIKLLNRPSGNVLGMRIRRPIPVLIGFRDLP